MEHDQFSDVRTVVSEPLKFKSKLAIGDEAYGSALFVNRLQEYWDAYGWATTGAAAAKSTVIATTFFAPSGLLGAIGLGGAAVTPFGWVIAAAVLTGGAAIGVRKFWNDSNEGRVTVIPKFINTPIDLLAISLFDLMAPLALKVAAIDGCVAKEERKYIRDFFVNEWGYDELFLNAGFQLLESKLEDFTIQEIAVSLAKFSKENPDCNYRVMTRNLVEFLKGVMEADGKIDEREELAIEKIQNIFKEAERTFSQANLKKVSSEVINSGKKGAKTVADLAGGLGRFTQKNTQLFFNSDAVGNAKEVTKKSTLATFTVGKNLVAKVLKRT